MMAGHPIGTQSDVYFMKTKSQIISIVLATLVILSVLFYVFKELTADPYGKDSVSALGELRKIITSTPRDSEAFIVTKGDTVLPMADMQIFFFKDEFNGQFERFKGGYFSERESLADRLFAENPTLKAQHDQFDESISSIQKRIKDAPGIANARWQALIQKDKDSVAAQQQAFDQSRKTYEAQVLQMIAKDKMKLENFAELIKEQIINLNTVMAKISNDSKVELTNLQAMLERYPQEIQMKIEKGEKDSKEIMQKLIDEQKAIVKSRKEDLVPTRKAEDDLMEILNQYDPKIKKLEDEASQLEKEMKELEEKALKTVNDHIISEGLTVKTLGSSSGILKSSKEIIDISRPSDRTDGLDLGPTGERSRNYVYHRALTKVPNECSGIAKTMGMLSNKWTPKSMRLTEIEGAGLFGRGGLIDSMKASRQKAMIPWNNRYTSLNEKRFLVQRQKLKDALDLEEKKLVRMEEDKGGDLLATMDFDLNDIMKLLSINMKIQAALNAKDHKAIGILDKNYADNYRSMKNHESFQAALKANEQEEFADLMPNYAEMLAKLERSMMAKKAIDNGAKNELAKLSPEYQQILQSLEVNQGIEDQINKKDLAKYESKIIGFDQLTQAKKTLEDTSNKFVYEEILSGMVSPFEEQLAETQYQKSQFMERALGNKQLELIDTYYYKFLGLLKEKSFLKIRAGSRGQFKIPSNAKYIFAERIRNNGEHIFWFIEIEDNNINFHLSNSNAHIASGGDNKRWVYSHTLN
jgi:hypothetical protein